MKTEKKFFYARVLSDTNIYKVSLSTADKFLYGAEVIIKTEFGLDLATITSWKTKLELGNKKIKPFESGTLIRYANAEDKELKRLTLIEATAIKKEVNQLKEQHGLPMNITHLIYPICRKTIGIFYTSNERVDFRELLVSLRQAFNKKIILRQISPAQREKSFVFDPRVPTNKYKGAQG